jgi:RNA polymerase sigma factor (sigma-70 family)
MTASDADAALIERVKLGDVKAFEMLVVKYQRRIERLIGRMVRDVDLVPDIAQETFIRAYRAIPQFRGESAFYTWLYRIAVNTAKKSLMELKRDPLITETARASRDEEDETSRVENELSDGETPDAVLASKQIAAGSEPCHRRVVRRAEAGDHVARNRRPQLRRNRRNDELSDRNRAVPDLPRSRGDCAAPAPAARNPAGRALVSSTRRPRCVMERN